MKTERKIPIFPTLGSAERWVANLPCKGGSCEGDTVGDPPRMIRLNCWRHGLTYEIAYRLVAFQDRYVVDPYDD